uniref:non-specific serine/threonine protein kinase n=1 Tax=Globodera rostochiensis TaxID=31243 RepID=A0A914IAM6_GLORO
MPRVACRPSVFLTKSFAQQMTLRSPIYGEKDNISSLVQKIRDAEYPPLPDRCYYTAQLELLVRERSGQDDISAELELFVDDEVSSAVVAVAAQPTPLDNWPPSTRQQQLHKRLSSADLPFPPPSPQFHRFHPFLANHHNQQKQQQVITETSSGEVVGQRDTSSSVLRVLLVVYRCRRCYVLQQLLLTEIDMDSVLYQSVINEVNIFKTLNNPNIIKSFYSFEELSRFSISWRRIGSAEKQRRRIGSAETAATNWRRRKGAALAQEVVHPAELEERDEILREVITGTLFQQRKTNDHRLLVPEADIWRVFTQIADAVQYIHKQHIIHRDLKPPNVLLTTEDTVKLTNFGLSRQQNAGSRVQTVCGTPYYMSPERILEESYTTKSDVWSLGYILYEICPLLNKLPRATYLLLRYLFAFLNHLSELSDENMMDPYNLAICFGPTLLPIPEGKHQVCYQNSVNEVIKNLIVHSDAIFNARVPGPRYEKYALEATDGGGTPAGDISAELELFLRNEIRFAHIT